jgi:hypothetical protein
MQRGLLAAGQAEESKPAAFSLAYIPREALLVVGLRPASLLQRPAVRPFSTAVRDTAKQSYDLQVPPNEVLEVVAFAVPRARTMAVTALKVRTASPSAMDALMTMFDPAITSSSYAGHTYHQYSTSDCWCRLDDTTLLLAPDLITMRRCLGAGETGASDAKWARRWAAVGTADGAAVANTSLTRALSHASMNARLTSLTQYAMAEQQVQTLGFTIAPLWQKSNYVMAELTATDEIVVRIVSESGTEEEASAVYSAMSAVLRQADDEIPDLAIGWPSCAFAPSLMRAGRSLSFYLPLLG